MKAGEKFEDSDIEEPTESDAVRAKNFKKKRYTTTLLA
jgi:hypothetical protein